MQDLAKLGITKHANKHLSDHSTWLLDIPSTLLGLLVGLLIAIFVMNHDLYEIDQAGNTQIEAHEPNQVKKKKSINFEFYGALRTYEVVPRQIEQLTNYYR